MRSVGGVVGDRHLATAETGPGSTDVPQPAALLDASAGADLANVSTSAHHLLYDEVFGAILDRPATHLDCTVLPSTRTSRGGTRSSGTC